MILWHEPAPCQKRPHIPRDNLFSALEAYLRRERLAVYRASIRMSLHSMGMTPRAQFLEPRRHISTAWKEQLVLARDRRPLPLVFLPFADRERAEAFP